MRHVVLTDQQRQCGALGYRVCVGRQVAFGCQGLREDKETIGCQGLGEDKETTGCQGLGEDKERTKRRSVVRG